MIKPPPPRSTGIAGLVFLFCIAAGVAGLGLDLLLGLPSRMGLADQPGARAVLGVGVAAGLVLCAHALRFLLGRLSDAEERGDGRVDHT